MAKAIDTPPVRNNPQSTVGTRRLVSIYPTPAEHEYLKKAARDAGLSLSRLLVDALEGRDAHPRIDNTNAPALSRALNRIESRLRVPAAILNKQARHANTHRTIPESLPNTLHVVDAQCVRINDALDQHLHPYRQPSITSPVAGGSGFNNPVGGRRQISISLTTEQHEIYKQTARYRHVSLSRLFLEAALEDKSTRLSPKNVQQAVNATLFLENQIAGCAKNTKQLLRHATSGSPIQRHLALTHQRANQAMFRLHKIGGEFQR